MRWWGSLLLFTLAAALWPAAVMAVDGDGVTTFEVPLKGTHGLSVKLEADDDEIELQVHKGNQYAVYFARGKVTPEGIAVKFGALGEFDVDYQAFRTLETHEPGRRCTGEPRTTTEGFLRGVIRFRGEGGYVRVEASRVKGTLVFQPEWDCDYRRAGASRAALARKVDDEEATLGAVSRRTGIRFGVIGARRKGERPSTFFAASSLEAMEGVRIARYTFAGNRSAAGFEFDNRRGTATVDPPAPFAGSAYFRRRPNGRNSWRGSLTGPLLGLGRVRLAGPGFKAAMVPRLPNFE